MKEKLMQYGMLAVLFLAAAILPGYAAGKSAEQKGIAVVNEKISETKGTIVIDAGHGGSDPGMVGSSGIIERDLNLIYAGKLETVLREAGYRVIQTRENEQGLYDADSTHKKAQDMQRRIAIIAREKPLLTVSIHQNSYPEDSSIYGPQVFYFAQSAEGEKLAVSIQNSLNARLGIAKPRTAKGNASYYILKKSEGTAVIVECGFLTSPEDEKVLQQEEYQNRFVQALSEGIQEYLHEAENNSELSL